MRELLMIFYERCFSIIVIFFEYREVLFICVFIFLVFNMVFYLLNVFNECLLNGERKIYKYSVV